MKEDLSSTNFCENPETEDKLSDQDGGDADGEFGMAGLVAEKVHSGQRADAAAQQYGADQGPLGDAPAVIAGFFLVSKHKQECGCID